MRWWWWWKIVTIFLMLLAEKYCEKNIICFEVSTNILHGQIWKILGSSKKIFRGLLKNGLGDLKNFREYSTGIWQRRRRIIFTIFFFLLADESWWWWYCEKMKPQNYTTVFFFLPLYRDFVVESKRAPSENAYAPLAWLGPFACATKWGAKRNRLCIACVARGIRLYDVSLHTGLCAPVCIASRLLCVCACVRTSCIYIYTCVRLRPSHISHSAMC